MKLTKEQQSISNKNHKLAVEYFKWNGEWFKHCELHHINPDWRNNDVERYIQWNPRDLAVLSKEEHRKLHQVGREVSIEVRTNISNALKGRTISEESKEKNRQAHLGKKTSEETKKKLSDIHKGKLPWNTGKNLSEDHKNKISNALKGVKRGPCTDEHRDSLSKAHKGMHWWNNGIEQTQAYECPEGWVQGRLKNK